MRLGRSRNLSPDCIVVLSVAVYYYYRYSALGQRPELSQATGMALVRCILGKFLGVGCHYFPPCL